MVEDELECIALGGDFEAIVPAKQSPHNPVMYVDGLVHHLHIYSTKILGQARLCKLVAVLLVKHSAAKEDIW